MLIPGLPPAGAQQEVFKPDRRARTTAASGLAHDPLAELPVEEQPVFEQSGQRAEAESGDQPEPELVANEAESAPSDAAGLSELPRKGLLVDIRA